MGGGAFGSGRSMVGVKCGRVMMVSERNHWFERLYGRYHRLHHLCNSVSAIIQ